ncbi:serine/threonine-protein kinase [Thermomonospora cellulosilytica]|uniref:non-specific serine/threonine protein kinase n=1 Tax=Thermomonospora cellulosilytica TaxID=1411118 RepID=A0A7W3MX22_9ACTN|nr:serine/threonine-protein kinase [Thermomonospora cellulosilytica]MBA9003424.1 hypothetical protein [Thermomonospora cellulosilytica]
MGEVLADRYELIAPLGRGGMGQVWEARDRRLGGRRVAVKLLTDDQMAAHGDSTELLRRFTREASVTAGLQHPGVPAVHDAGPYAGGLYLVMELVEGRSLADLVDAHGPLPVGWAAAIAAQVCAVLAIAHDRGLVHRDIKPQNLMLTRDGTVKVLDFGVATVLEAGPGLTRITHTGAVIGTPAYMAPEQLRGERPGPRTDLYALGCVLYEMLSGGPVFAATTAHAMIAKHLQETPAPLHRTDLNPELHWLVRQLLAKDPAQRPGSAREVYERLLPYVGEATRLGDIDPVGGASSAIHTYARILVRLSGTTASTAAPQNPYAAYSAASTAGHGGAYGGYPQHVPGTMPAGAARPQRSFGRLLRHLLWTLPSALGLGFFNWIGFLYVGLRHQNKGWLASAVVYMLLSVGLLGLIVSIPEETHPLDGVAAGYLFLMWFGGFFHSMVVAVQRLRLLDRDPPPVPYTAYR